MVTADVTSLYPNIDIAFALRIFNDYFTEIKFPNKDLFITVLEFVLSNRICKYNDRVYKQIDGIAMGTLIAPPFANLFLFILERILLLKYKEYILF